MTLVNYVEVIWCVLLTLKINSIVDSLTFLFDPTDPTDTLSICYFNVFFSFSYVVMCEFYKAGTVPLLRFERLHEWKHGQQIELEHLNSQWSHAEKMWLPVDVSLMWNAKMTNVLSICNRMSRHLIESLGKFLGQLMNNSIRWQFAVLTNSGYSASPAPSLSLSVSLSVSVTVTVSAKRDAAEVKFMALFLDVGWKFDHFWLVFRMKEPTKQIPDKKPTEKNYFFDKDTI